MLDFKKSARADIWNVIEVLPHAPKKGKTFVGLIGQAKTLLEQNIIFEDNVKGNEEKWLAIARVNPENAYEFDTLRDAKMAFLLHEIPFQFAE